MDVDSTINDQGVDVLQWKTMSILQEVLTIDCNLEGVHLTQDDQLKESIRSEWEIGGIPLFTSPRLVLQCVAYHRLSLETRVKVERDVWARVDTSTALEVHMKPVWVGSYFSTEEDKSAWSHSTHHWSSMWHRWVKDAARSMDVPSRLSLEPNRVNLYLAINGNGIDTVQVLDAMVVLNEVLSIHSNLELVCFTEYNNLKVLVEIEREMRLAPLFSTPLLILEGVSHARLSPESGIEVQGYVCSWICAGATLQVNVEPVSSCWYKSLDENHPPWSHGSSIDGAHVWERWIQHKWKLSPSLLWVWVCHLVGSLLEFGRER